MFDEECFRSYTPHDSFSEKLFRTPIKLGLVNGFRYTSYTSFSEEFLYTPQPGYV